ncbi:hypothetical protein [Bartonella kosoyi]|uniref:hypothetical protein n=1 Tax=Bartonella kosoyi TaxID=2133959 RepID=UPI001FCF0383|nr:hypothetical protein [Bartonella kosoyi]
MRKQKFSPRENPFLKKSEIFANGIQKVFNLSRTGHRVLIIVLEECQSNKTENKNNNSITLIWFDGGVNGKKHDMVDRTFHNGLRELIQKGILKPKLPNQYWINPILFFKGNKITFMKEYQIDLEDFTKI